MRWREREGREGSDGRSRRRGRRGRGGEGGSEDMSGYWRLNWASLDSETSPSLCRERERGGTEDQVNPGPPSDKFGEVLCMVTCVCYCIS